MPDFTCVHILHTQILKVSYAPCDAFPEAVAHRVCRRMWALMAGLKEAGRRTYS